jgi:glycosyltransferase involved in cell wall biosynthesis
MVQFVFWVCAGVALYSYFIYPALLWIIVRIRRRDFSPGEAGPPVTVSLIITAYNEQARIRSKIDNALCVAYPGLEIIVASDCSVDDTDRIVLEYAERGVRLVRAPLRLGKENAQLSAIREAAGDIVVFSDVATQIPSDAFHKLMPYFQDPRVGAVSSEDRFIGSEGLVVGEGAYVRYEMWLRRLESKCAGLVGLSGSFFAVRKLVCEQWDVESPSDFNSALNCARLGMRAVAAADVVGYYPDLKDPQRERQRKVRTVVRGLAAIARHREVLSLRRYGLFAWQVWSHKVFRWLVPWALLLVLTSNVLLLGRHWIYVLSLVAQLLLYGFAICGQLSDRFTIPRMAHFFVQANVAILQAWWLYGTGTRVTTWQPSTR